MVWDTVKAVIIRILKLRKNNWVQYLCERGRMCVCDQWLQLCPTLCDPMDYSQSGSSVCRISQARVLERVAISSSKGSSWPRDWTHVSCIGRWILYCWATARCGNVDCKNPLNIFQISKNQDFTHLFYITLKCYFLLIF